MSDVSLQIDRLNKQVAQHRRARRFEQAIPPKRQIVEIVRAAKGEVHLDFAASLNNLAALYQDVGDHAAALPLCRQALELRRAALGEAHPHFAASLNNLAVLYQDMGDHEGALPLCRQWVQATCGWLLRTVLRPVGVKGFVLLPRRWVVERTFGWLYRYRRLSKDYEYLISVSETMIVVAMIHLMARRNIKT
jgi:tetratricopeptide (TPR) repeat protein